MPGLSFNTDFSFYLVGNANASAALNKEIQMLSPFKVGLIKKSNQELNGIFHFDPVIKNISDVKSTLQASSHLETGLEIYTNLSFLNSASEIGLQGDLGSSADLNLKNESGLLDKIQETSLLLNVGVIRRLTAVGKLLYGLRMNPKKNSIVI